jgi:hypothetical protein
MAALLSGSTRLVAAIALAFLRHTLSLRTPIGSERPADIDLLRREPT